MSTLTVPSRDLGDASFADEAFACPRPLRLVLDPAVLTPELALVCPELAAVARARLPERPWEAALGGSSRSEAAPVKGAALRLATPEPEPEPAPTQAPARLPDAEQPSVARSRSEPLPRRSRRRARRALELGVVVALFVGVAHLGAWESGGEELLPPESQGEGVLYPGTVYIASPSGSLATDDHGTMITEFVLPLTCAGGPPVVRDLAIEGLLFGANGVLSGSGVTVQVSGEVVDREHVRGTVSAQGPGCQGGEVLFSARVS